MFKRIAAICFIFICATVAWMILGATIVSRTDSSGERLRGRVQSVWGVPQIQAASSAEYRVPVVYKETIEEKGLKRIEERTRMETRVLHPTASDLEVSINLEHRQKGLLWYSTYKVSFRGDYEFR